MVYVCIRLYLASLRAIHTYINIISCEPPTLVIHKLLFLNEQMAYVMVTLYINYMNGERRAEQSEPMCLCIGLVCDMSMKINPAYGFPL